jgi:hypothetical protein
MPPLFDELYSHTGRPSITPEKLLRALLLQVLYTVRSERMLMEQTGLQPAVPLVRWVEHGRSLLNRSTAALPTLIPSPLRTPVPDQPLLSALQGTQKKPDALLPHRASGFYLRATRV